MDTSRKLRKLTHKLRYLREELAEVEEIRELGKWELNNAVFEVFARMGAKVSTPNQPVEGDGVDTPDPESPTDNQDDSPTPSDPDVKKLTRKIAMKTHPDRISNLPDEEKEALVSLYRDAMDAARQGDKGRLIEIAIDLDIEVDIEDDECTTSLETLTTKIESNITETKKRHEVAWVHAKNDLAVRKTMLAAVVRSMGLSPDDSLLNDVIQWVIAGCPGGTKYVKQDRQAVNPKIWDRRRPGTRPERIRR
jgi:hypothetical protein